MGVGILTDLTKCIGCQACVVACREINGLPLEPEAETLDYKTWTIIERSGEVNIRRQCMHCLDPTCVSVCPVTALERTEIGAVIYHEDRCIGCRYCLMACPFEIPKYEWGEILPRVRKCILCYEKRVSQGAQPACTSVCPTGATVFGQRDNLVVEAKDRIRENPQRYVDYIYGIHEAGGTSILYLSDVPFEQLGFKMARLDEAYSKLTWRILSQIPNVVLFGGVLMVGIWWVINRREEVGKGKENENNT